MSKPSISLPTAIFICINTILGAGAFVNLKQLSISIHQWGFLSYLVSAVLVLPLILCICKLGEILPQSGGLYIYSKTYLNEFWGFLAGWSYFISKSASVGLLAHLLASYIQSAIPGLEKLPALAIDFSVIATIVLISFLGAITNKKIQLLITALKMVPLAFAFIVGFINFSPAHFIGTTTQISSFFLAIPSALYGLIGFEVICSIGGLIENPAINIRRSILTAFGIVVGINIFLQLSMYGSLGLALAQSSLPLADAGGLISPVIYTLGKILNGAFLTAICGGIIAIMSGNSWNLYTLTTNNHFPFKSYLTHLNKHHMPSTSLIVQGCIAGLMLVVTQEFVPLQNMSIFGVFITFLLTSIAALQVTKKENRPFLSSLKAYGAMIVCAGIVTTCLINIYKFGISFSFISIFLSGCLLAYFNHCSNSRCSDITNGTGNCK